MRLRLRIPTIGEIASRIVQVELRWHTAASCWILIKNIVILSSRSSLLSHRLIPAPVQEQSDAHRDEECHRIVHEYIDSVIVRLEQQDDEQVIEHDGDQHPCNSDTGIVLQGEAFPLPEPP